MLPFFTNILTQVRTMDMLEMIKNFLFPVDRRVDISVQ
jgi:hypothetical protein